MNEWKELLDEQMNELSLIQEGRWPVPDESICDVSRVDVDDENRVDFDSIQSLHFRIPNSFHQLLNLKCHKNDNSRVR